MSNEEMKQQKARLLIERDDAAAQVQHLREKAIGIGRTFKLFGQDIERQPETVIEISSQNGHGEVGLSHYHPAQVKLLQVDAAFAVADELRSALRTVNDLEQRMRNLGMRP